MLIFSHSHQDPRSAVLNVLELLKARARGPDEKSITVIQPGGDKGVDQFFGVGQGEGGAELGYVSEVKEGCFAEVFDVGCIVELRVRVGGSGQRR